MNVADELKKIKQDLKRINALLMQLDQVAGEHNLLGTRHPDTDPDDPIAGDIIIADAIPAWARLPKGSDGEVLQLIAGFPAWDDIDHDLLSSIHPDTVPDTVERGDLITGQDSLPFWERLPIGLSGELLSSNGTDVIWNKPKIDDLATPDDNTDLNASTSAHGLCPKLPNDSTKYLNGEGNWAVPEGGGGGGGDYFDTDYFGTESISDLCDHFDDETIFESGSIWTEFQAGANITITEEDHHCKMVTAASDGDKWRGMFTAIPTPSGSFTITAKMCMPRQGQRYGIALFEDATNNPNTCDLEIFCFDNGISVLAQYFSDWDSYGGGDYSQNLGIDKNVHGIYLRVRKSGTTWYFDYSLDGKSWQISGYSRTARFTAAEFGLLVHNESSNEMHVWIDWVFFEETNNLDPPGNVRAL